jgi:hypothetical protein
VTIRRPQQSATWVFFAWAAFAVAIGAMMAAVNYMPVPPWSRGFVAVAALMLVQASVVLTKTVRDQAEALSDADQGPGR